MLLAGCRADVDDLPLERAVYFAEGRERDLHPDRLRKHRRVVLEHDAV
jgi:hypothetical protein